MTLRDIISLLPALAFAVLLSCSGGDNVAGGSSGTPNGVIAATVRNADGTPAAGLLVRVRTATYLAGDAYDSRTGRDLFTNDTGGFVADSLDSGDYVVECTDTIARTVFAPAELNGTSPSADLGRLVIDTGFTVPMVLRGPGKEPVTGTVRVRGLERSAAGDSAGRCTLRLMCNGTFTFSTVPALGGYTSRLDTITLSDTATDTIAFAFAPTGQKKVRINTTATAALIDEALVGFPLLLRLDSSNFDFSAAAPGGSDLRLIRKGRDLYHEVESWDATAQRAAIWVRVDTLLPDAVDSLDLVWGTPTLSGFSVPDRVFDTADGFAGVWHLSEVAPGSGAAGIYKDATGHHRDGIDQVTNAGKAGLIGTGQRFSGTDHIEVTPAFAPQDSFTIEAWFIVDTLPQDVAKIVGTFNDSTGYSKGWQMKLRKYDLNFDAGDGSPRLTAAKWQVVSAQLWYHYAAIYRPGTGTVSLFLNGAPVTLDDTVTAPSIVYPIPARTYISDPELPFAGTIDEVRFSSIARTASWIRACYENQRADQRMVVVE